MLQTLYRIAQDLRNSQETYMWLHAQPLEEGLNQTTEPFHAQAPDPSRSTGEKGG